jgi:hypothetical protein
VNRAEEVRRAAKQANLPLSAVVVIDTLLCRADWATAHLPAKYQPRSVAELAAWAGIARSTCETALDIGERHGWIERTAPGELRRGASTTYQVRMGWPRQVDRRQTLSDAERAKRYRQRKKERHETPGT